MKNFELKGPYNSPDEIPSNLRGYKTEKVPVGQGKEVIYVKVPKTPKADRPAQ